LGTHDLSYRRLFSQPRMVKELVRDFVEESWVERLDFSTLERVNASYVSKSLKNREGDLVWRLRLREGGTVYLHLRPAGAPVRAPAVYGGAAQSEIPGRIGLEEFRNMLEKTVQQWNRELREEGREEGRQEGWREGRREGWQEGLLQIMEQRFGPLDSHTLTRVRTAEEDQLRIWAGRLLTAASLEGVFEDEAH
jgi:Putative transposase, YhgA-like